VTLHDCQVCTWRPGAGGGPTAAGGLTFTADTRPVRRPPPPAHPLPEGGRFVRQQRQAAQIQLQAGALFSGAASAGRPQQAQLSAGCGCDCT
jgi:hypothetical protein